ncbi:MAG: helix-turn-helix domain-containing protein, partial [archaeon]
MIEDILIEFGLTKNEAKIYLAALSLGSLRVNEISKKTNILRTTTYEVLNSLIKKGVANYIIKSGVRYYTVVNPKELITILDRKKQKIKEILPELLNIQKYVENPKVEFYEGKEGLKTILDDIIKTRPKELLTIGSSKVLETLEFYFPQWIKRRVKCRIKARILQENVKSIKDLKKLDKNNLREIRYLPKDFKINVFIH